MAPPGSGPITAPAGNVAYKVTSQTPTTGIGPDGKPTGGYQVNFTTGGGAAGYVFIPYGMYSADNVKALIGPHARELDLVQGLAQGM